MYTLKNGSDSLSIYIFHHLNHSFTSLTAAPAKTMALFPSLAFVHAFVILLLLPSSYCFPSIRAENRSATLPDSDTDLLEFSLNWKFLEAEFFLHGALGHGLDMFAPNLTFGGPQPIGARMANLDPFSRDIILQFAWHHVGHLRYGILISKFNFSFELDDNMTNYTNLKFWVEWNEMLGVLSSLIRGLSLNLECFKKDFII